MKFKIIVQVTSRKRGVELLEEYNRLNFEDFPRIRSKEFGVKQVTLNVSDEFAIKYRELFKDKNEITIKLDSSDTDASCYESWGSQFAVLHAENLLRHLTNNKLLQEN